METEALSLSANSSLVKKAKMTKDSGPGFRDFRSRHLGSGPDQTQQMLNELGLKTLEELIDKTVPKSIRMKKTLDLGKSLTEEYLIDELKQLASQNQIFRSYIGLGYYGTLVPSVIQRNILENPGWYTQYTPYQAEISQGRLEALLNFQTMVKDLTAMEIANASLLDEATAAAEAVSMAYNLVGEDNKKTVFVSDQCFPQTEAVVRTRSEALGLNVEVGNVESLKNTEKYFAVLVQYPNMSGALSDLTTIADCIHKTKGLLIVAADLLSLTLFTPPGEMGADIVVGSTQRFGVPFGFGGPHAAYLATRDEFKRQMPGRLVGVSVDSRGKRALRLALQTREQHIRRAKATSNICTAQVLLAIMAGMYAVYHGPQGLKQIASRVQFYTSLLAAGLRKLGIKVLNDEKSALFDTLWVELSSDKSKSFSDLCKKAKINFNQNVTGKVGISLDETVTERDVVDIWNIFANGKALDFKFEDLAAKVNVGFGSLERKTKYLTHPVFNTYFTETEFLRYVTRLQNRDLSLATSMIPLGSCTMKLNATTEMVAVTWPEFSNIHPFAPKEQYAGYLGLFEGLEKSLAEITGFDGVSLQPNAGSQGEYAGLLVIKKYLQSKGQGHRDICLIPNSAHGTNPATAVMVGFKVVGVECDAQGNISLEDLRKKSQEHSKSLAAIMVTYPSTHGVFEESIIDICDIIHNAGGQVYMDGANMNAQVGLCRPGDFGPDVCHLNLHKTFCIPHGGGGPGMGPICVKSHLKPFLPGHPVVKVGGENAVGAVSAAPWGSPGILPIPYAYIRMMGADGLKDSTILAILNANYIAKKLDPVFPVLFKGKNGFVAHECIIDLRNVKTRSGIEVEDIAKRLMDYGFHAPTMSWPVIGTMMIEPTESESKAELDRFCDAMLSIAKEINEVETGALDKLDNPLKNAPHTADAIASDTWNHKYSREKAAYPAPWLREGKFWPFVGRIDNPYGDKNLVCACPPVESYS